MKNIPDKSVDMILCDLPYGFTDCKWDSIIPFESLWEQYKRILKIKGVAVLFGNQPFTTKLINSNIKDFSHIWYWNKNNKTGALNAKKQPLRNIEEISVFVCNKNKPGKYTYNPQGVRDLEKPKIKKEHENIKYSVYTGVKPKTFKQTKTGYPTTLLKIDNVHNTGERRLHPTQKPVELCEYLIKTYSNEGETILDNCMGSGSTGVAALKNNRKFIGIELDEKYFDVACNRLGEYILDGEQKKMCVG